MADVHPLPVAAAEATGAPIKFECDGIEYTIPNPAQWPLSALLAFEEDRIASFIKALLGPEQFARYIATEPTLTDLGRFVEALQAAAGIAGN